jgi:hypothetical protein
MDRASRAPGPQGVCAALMHRIELKWHALDFTVVMLGERLDKSSKRRILLEHGPVNIPT